MYLLEHSTVMGLPDNPHNLLPKSWGLTDAQKASQSAWQESAKFLVALGTVWLDAHYRLGTPGFRN